MPRYTESRELVQAIGREILAQGRAVTNAEVAAIIQERTGRRVSPNLVTEELQRFWALIGTELADRHRVPDLPPALASAAQAFWIQAVDHADQRWAQSKAELEAALEKTKGWTQNLETQLETLHAQYQEAESILAAERAARVQLESERARLSERNTELEQAQTTLAGQLNALEQQLTSAQQAQAWQQQAHENALAAATARLAHAEDAGKTQAAAAHAAEQARHLLASELESVRAALEHERLNLAGERRRAERLALQVQMLEREERAGRRVRQGLARRRPGGSGR